MQTFKRISKAVMVLCVLFTLSGCWDNIDINHRMLPISMAISKVDEGYKVFLQIPVPSENEMGIRAISATGKTIDHALDKLSMNIEKKVDLPHVKIIIFDKSLAQKGLKDIITNFMRSQDISPKAIVVICDEDLSSFFANTIKNKDPSGLNIYEFFEKNAGWNPQIALTRVWEVYRSVHSYTRDTNVSIIKSGKDTAIEHTGSAILRNGKMVARINSDETLLVNAFKGQSAQGKVEWGSHVSALIVNEKLRNKSSLVNNRPYMKSVMKLKVVVLETMGDPTPEEIQNELETILTEHFNRMFKKIQASEADILGVGQEFRILIPRKELENWRTDYYPHLKMDFSVQVEIENEGNLYIDPH